MADGFGDNGERTRALLEETDLLKSKMIANIESAVDNYGALDDLEKKTKGLKHRASKFRRKSVLTRQMAYWRNIKYKLRSFANPIV